MRKLYKRQAWLVDDGILVSGYVSKRVFYPNHPIACGFSYQKIRRKDIGKILFYSKSEACASLHGIFLKGKYIYSYR